MSNYKSAMIGQELYVDELSFKKIPFLAQVEIVKEVTKQGKEIVFCEFPTVNLQNIQNLVQSYSKKPLLTLAALRLHLPSDGSLDNEIADFEQKLEAFSESLDKLVASSKDSYVFAEVPSDFDFDKTFKVLETRIRRTDANYFLMKSDIKRLMNTAFHYWKKGFNDSEGLPIGYHSFKQHSTSHRVVIFPRSIQIGCQRIQRYELEAAAVHLGFNGEPFEGVTSMR